MRSLRIAFSVACAAILAAGCGASAPRVAKSGTPTPSPSATAHVGAKRSLRCQARAIHGRPREHTRAGIRVHTRPHARVAAIAHWSPFSSSRAAGRAGGHGDRTLRLPVGAAAHGIRIAIVVRVSWHGRHGACRAFLRPRRARAARAAHPTTAPTSAPPPPPTSAPPSPSPPPSPTHESCYPLTSGGNCYEPGEYCRDSDHGMHGVAGDGEKIICEDNNGWRWEPA